MEWLKLYAALLNKEKAAGAFFSGLMEKLTPILDETPTGKTAVFFYITSNGAVNVRKPGDYITKSIGLAGGKCIFQDLDGGGSALSTMNMQIESFYGAMLSIGFILLPSRRLDGCRCWQWTA